MDRFVLQSSKILYIGLLLRTSYDDIHFSRVTQDLGYQYTDLDETLRMYTVDPEIIKYHISTSVTVRKFQSSKPEVEKYLIGKLVGFHNQSHTFYLSILKAPRINFVQVCPYTHT